MNDEEKRDLILALMGQSKLDPFSNMTVPEVAKDLRMGENKANEVFRRPDFPSVNIGKTKTVNVLAYWLWKMNKKEE